MLLGDKNGEVQNLAVKCLGPLVGKVKGNRVENIVDVLGNNMLSQSEQLRGISTMGKNYHNYILKLYNLFKHSYSKHQIKFVPFCRLNDPTKLMPSKETLGETRLRIKAVLDLTLTLICRAVLVYFSVCLIVSTTRADDGDK